MSDVRDPSDEKRTTPDYELAPEVRADTPTQLKALGHPVRNAILHLVAERAATTSELADTVGRSHGTVAHHLRVLEDAGLVRVVRTRRVRAVTESFWGRTGRTILVDPPPGEQWDDKALFVREAMETFRDGEHGYTTLRYARISAGQVDAFQSRLTALVDEFLALERTGDAVYGLLVALQPTDQPALPDRADGDG
ncbi:winged helix-turn-helix transcriptional regulator [Iamia sp. SCSIO 61187]|uniref:ArsR/SmtB family transcription factor n=1 Tax=Iamia sp. SCSIO 61187 TaxID=2722752 RepID=UPI001C62C31B|nr:winged helix-turn-helix domain-containing protein [Iamia sp. SCSIO 61187]QYG91998.1 winged helix-turn-helix transcriptional regulator [Iamia sp. SCSIO 61187]